MIKIVIGVMLFTGVITFSPHHVFAVDCTVPASGNLSISSSCIFPGTINGADAGTGTTNTASVTVSNGATLTIAADQTIAVGSLIPSGGSVAIITGGQIKIGSPLWMTDADSDGYPSAATQVVQASAPTNGRRRNLLTSLTQADANDAIACATNGASGGTCQTCLNGGPSNASAGTDPNSDCASSYNSCSGNNQIGPDGNCNGAGACNTGGLSSACSTAGTCQTGGGCSAGSCVAVSNVAAGADTNNECNDSGTTIYFTGPGYSGNSMCASHNKIGANCNGNGSCSKPSVCINFGTDAAATNHKQNSRYLGNCFEGTTACNITNYQLSPLLVCGGYTTEWQYTQCN